MGLEKQLAFEFSDDALPQVKLDESIPRPSLDRSSLELMTEHKMVRVRWEHLDAQIDEEIAPLIVELWKAQLLTMMSCQGSPEGWVWIQFPIVVFAEGFMNLIENESGIPSLWQQWKVEVYPITLPETFFVDYPEALIPTGPSLRFAVSIRFPKTDLPTVLETIMRHNSGVSAECSPGLANPEGESTKSHLNTVVLARPAAKSSRTATCSLGRLMKYGR